MKDKVLDFLEKHFEKFGYGAGATYWDIAFSTKLKRFELEPILEELIAENKIRIKTGEHIDLYFSIKSNI